MGKLAELIAPDVVWHVPGTNLISGTDGAAWNEFWS